MLPLVIELDVNGKKVVIAHADYPSNEYAFGKMVDPQDVVWNRSRFNRIIEGMGSDIAGADAFYFGHTPIKMPTKAWNQNYIDTGAVFGGQLTMVKIKGEGDEGIE
jgi:serine/threonine protein phosphatase 1